MSCCWIWRSKCLLRPNLSLYKRWNKIMPQLWQTYKILNEIISKDSWQKAVNQSRVVVLQKQFFLVVNRREHFFKAQYFTKVVAANHSSIDTLFLGRALATINCIYKITLTVYLRRIFISKEHLPPYIWVAPSFFQEASCSDLVFSMALCFF